jgi:tRNA threonylcarbamoyladenosine biosynthesis protein TsaE
MTGVFKVSSIEETAEIARRLASEIKGGEVICLLGDLGAGKTAFTQSFARALGVTGRVSSPTFCIVQEHPEAKLVHMDLYRLKTEDDVLAIGWEDYVEQGMTFVVEWPQAAGSLIPTNAIWVKIEHCEGGETERIITIE